MMGAVIGQDYFSEEEEEFGWGDTWSHLRRTSRPGGFRLGKGTPCEPSGPPRPLFQ